MTKKSGFNDFQLFVKIEIIRINFIYIFIQLLSFRKIPKKVVLKQNTKFDIAEKEKSQVSTTYNLHILKYIFFRFRPGKFLKYLLESVCKKKERNFKHASFLSYQGNCKFFSSSQKLFAIYEEILSTMQFIFPNRIYICVQ